MSTIANTVSPWKNKEEAAEARRQASEAQIQAYRRLLPTLLRRLENIPDPRNPKTIELKLVGLLLYGMPTQTRFASFNP